MDRRHSIRVWHRGTWTREEDQVLISCIEAHGAKKWSSIARKAGLKRSGKSCRLRWLNYLRPDIKRGNITEEEEDLIIRLHKLLGNRYFYFFSSCLKWSLIAGRLPGRTDNEIKNYWNKIVKKKMQKSTGLTHCHSLNTQPCTENIAMLDEIKEADSCNIDPNAFMEIEMEENFNWSNSLTDVDNNLVIEAAAGNWMVRELSLPFICSFDDLLGSEDALFYYN
ncbi:hypothetical protein ZIOFF_072092 [Zingiber officinale]|uniref:Uncharacterized protein n=1 Tax=Zingiber officinale TaxID=94328 RepID=A0A8J5ETT8_ZINOF|nr:hypothetical protein ZIOFF_072092 [Zingiber officinale]